MRKQRIQCRALPRCTAPRRTRRILRVPPQYRRSIDPGRGRRQPELGRNAQRGFVLSPSGEKQIAHFTTENSPLLSNSINDIAIDQQSGVVYIGTENGITSYQGEALAGERYHLANAEVFPNPVYNGYEGPIAIRGLSRDATVKITDINGRLVYETRALGGQAIWDGRDYQGRKVHSGVYLVFSATNPRESGFAAPTSAVARIIVQH